MLEGVSGVEGVRCWRVCSGVGEDWRGVGGLR